MTQKSLLLTSICLFVLSCCFAQRTISGVIHDDAGIELSNAVIKQLLTNKATVSDLSGRFSLKTENLRSTLLEISHPDYKALVVDASAFSDFQAKLVSKRMSRVHQGQLSHFKFIDPKPAGAGLAIGFPAYDTKSGFLILNEQQWQLPLSDKRLYYPQMVKVSKDNKFLALIFYGHLELWNLTTGIPVLQQDFYEEYGDLETDTNSSVGFNFTNDGSKLLVGCEACSKLREIDVQTGKVVRVFDTYQKGKSYLEKHYDGNKGAFYPLQSPDGKYVTTISQTGGICTWDYETGKMQGAGFFSNDALDNSPVQHPVFMNPKDGKIYSGNPNEGASQFNPVNNKIKNDQLKVLLSSYDNPSDFSNPITLFSAPDGDLCLATTYLESRQDTVRKYRIATWRDTENDLKFSRSNHKHEVNRFAVSNDQYLLASADKGGTIHIWFSASMELSKTIQIANRKHGNVPEVRYLQFTPDDRQLIVVTEDYTQIWDLEEEELLCTLVFFRDKTGWENDLQYCFYRPDGTYDIAPAAKPLMKIPSSATNAALASQFVPGLLGSIFGDRAVLSVQSPAFNPISGINSAGNPFVLKVPVQNSGGHTATINQIRIELPPAVNVLGATEISNIVLKAKTHTEAEFNFFIEKEYVDLQVPITVEIWGNGGYHFRQTYRFDLNPTTEITTTPPKATQTPALLPDRRNMDHAIFFAVNQYQSPELITLQDPIRNAHDIASALHENYGFKTSVVPNPTTAQIEDSLRFYQQRYASGQLDEKGQFLIFFSGHGEIEYDIGYFLPADTESGRLRTALNYPYLKSYIDNIPCQHILVVIDACYSGSFDPEIAMRGRQNLFKRPGELSEPEKFYRNHLDRMTRLFMSSGAKERTPDKSDFAKKLLDGLRRENRKGNLLTIGELFETYVKKASPTPLFRDFGKDEAGSSFILIGQ